MTPPRGESRFEGKTDHDLLIELHTMTGYLVRELKRQDRRIRWLEVRSWAISLGAGAGGVVAARYLPLIPHS